MNSNEIVPFQLSTCMLLREVWREYSRVQTVFPGTGLCPPTMQWWWVGGCFLYMYRESDRFVSILALYLNSWLIITFVPPYIHTKSDLTSAKEIQENKIPINQNVSIFTFDQELANPCPQQLLLCIGSCTQFRALNLLFLWKESSPHLVNSQRSRAVQARADYGCL